MMFLACSDLQIPIINVRVFMDYLNRIEENIYEPEDRNVFGGTKIKNRSVG